jgi:hypothetical protein
MPHRPAATTAGSPLDRIVTAVRAWEAVPVDRRQAREVRRRRTTNAKRVVVDQAKRAVMVRFGVDSHIALGILAAWARGLGIPLDRLAQAVVNGVPRRSASP